MLIIKRVVKDRHAHAALVREIQASAMRGSRKGFALPTHIYAEWVDGAWGVGGVEGDAYYICVPYAYAGPRHVVTMKWLVGHELAHVWQAFNGATGALRHDEGFYRAYRALVAPCAAAMELQYKPQAAKRHGVVSGLRKR